jgi:acetyl esterase/lipase
MDMKARLDPELVEPLDQLTAGTGGGFSLRDIPATRAMVSGMIAAIKEQVPPTAGVTSEDRRVSVAGALSGKAGPDVAVRLYRPDAPSGPLPVLIWMHGGGWVLGDLEIDDLMLRGLTKTVGCAVVNVDYRLSPEHSFPAAIDDCYAVLEWVESQGPSVGLDASRIAIGGGSAGAGLAAGVSLLARDRGSKAIGFQLLIYAAINDRNTAQVADGEPENLFWSRENTLRCWQAYLDGRNGSEDVPLYAAPIRAADLSGLPPAYLASGSLDMFLDDNLEYARRLNDAGVATELHVYPGAFHAFDAFAPAARLTQRFVADRDAALRRAFGLA